MNSFQTRFYESSLIRAFIRDLMIPTETIRLTYTLADTLSGATIKKLHPRT